MPANAIEFRVGTNLAPLQAGAKQAKGIVAGMVKGIAAASAAMAKITVPKMGSSSRGVVNFAKSLTSGVGVAIRGLEILSGSALAAGAAVAVGVRSAYELGSELQELSDRTGVAAGNLMVLQQAFKASGVEAEAVGSSINKMQKFLQAAGNSSSAQAAALNGLGVSLTTISQLAPDEQFSAIGRAINAIPDPTRRAAASMEIFGKAGGKFLSVFANGGSVEQASRAIGNQAKLLNDNAQIFHAVAERLNRVGLKLQGFFVGVAVRLEGVVLPLLDKFEQLDLSGMGQKFGEALVAGAKFMLGAFLHIRVLLASIGEFMVGMGLKLDNIVANSFMAVGKFLGDAIVATKPLFLAIGQTWQILFDAAVIGATAKLLQGVLMANAALNAGLDVAAANFTSLLGGALTLFTSKWGQALLNPVGFLSGALMDVALSFGKAMFHAMKGNVVGTLEAVATMGSIPAMLAKGIASMNIGSAAGPKVNFADQYRKHLTDGGNDALGAVIANLNADAGAKFKSTAGIFSDALNQTADDFAAATSKLKSTNVTADTFGAQKHLDAAQRGFDYLNKTGQKAGKAALAPTPMLDGKPVSAERAAQLQGIFGRVKANEMLYGKDQAALMNKPKPLSDAAASQLQEMYGKDAFGKMVDSTGALISHPATAQAFQKMGIGIGTSLDVDPLRRPGWTGAVNAFSNGTSQAPFRNMTGLSTGGLNGGAYGFHRSMAGPGMIRSTVSSRAAEEKAKKQSEMDKKNSLEATNNLLSGNGPINLSLQSLVDGLT